MMISKKAAIMIIILSHDSQFFCEIQYCDVNQALAMEQQALNAQEHALELSDVFVVS